MLALNVAVKVPETCLNVFLRSVFLSLHGRPSAVAMDRRGDLVGGGRPVDMDWEVEEISNWWLLFSQW